MLVGEFGYAELPLVVSEYVHPIEGVFLGWSQHNEAITEDGKWCC